VHTFFVKVDDLLSIVCHLLLSLISKVMWLL